MLKLCQGRIRHFSLFNIIGFIFNSFKCIHENRISDIIFERMISPHQWIDFIYNRTSKGIEHKKCLDILQGFTRKVYQDLVII